MSQPIVSPLSRRTRSVLAFLFALLLSEALWLAPGARDAQGAWVMGLLTGAWGDEEPLVVALFQLMGVWPMALLALLAPRLHRRPVPLWPFSLGSFALGAFALIPGLTLPGTPQPRPAWVRALRHPAFCVALALMAFGWASWGLATGSPARFAASWQAHQFEHIMAFDFVVLWLSSMLLAREEGGRWWLTVMPLLGAIAYAAQARPR